jgi:hypothetical protein
MAKQSFEFCNTKNGTRVVTKGMVDYRAVNSFFETKSLSLQACQATDAEETAGNIQKHNWKGVLIHLHKSGSLPRSG